LHTPQSDGQSLLAHFEQVEKATGRRPQELDVQDPPLEGLYLWEWFWDLHQGRQAGMSGPASISWLDIQAWARLNLVELEPWELQAIRAMDTAYLRAASKQKPKPKDKPKPKKGKR